MISFEKRREIEHWCQERNIDLINIREMKKGGRTRIITTIKCSKCHNRYDTIWDNLKRHEFAGMCTYCAHQKSAEYHRFQVQDIVSFIENNGYKVLTPIDKIKPKGKNQTYNKAKVEIMDAHGNVYNVIYNNFYNDVEYYRMLNGDGYSAAGDRQPSRLESMVIELLDYMGVEYKREFKFSDCRGDKRMLPFDFCINYKGANNRLLIEVDGELHYKEFAAKYHKNDKRKNYYCNEHNIPLLRIPYWEFEDDTYKQKIIDFINTNSSNDAIE